MNAHEGYRYVVLVKWPNGTAESFALPETVPLHVGHGQPSSPVPVFAPGTSCCVGSVIFHGDVPEWTVAKSSARVPDDPYAGMAADDSGADEIALLLSAQNIDELTETDARRMHALADYLTAHSMLYDLVEDKLSLLENWTTFGVFASNLDRARNLLQAMSSNAQFLVSTPADKLDLVALIRQSGPSTDEPATPSSSQPRYPHR